LAETAGAGTAVVVVAPNTIAFTVGWTYCVPVGASPDPATAVAGTPAS
jgi:hypothetical protein